MLAFILADRYCFEHSSITYIANVMLLKSRTLIAASACMDHDDTCTVG